MRAVVTGANGFVGVNLVDRLLAEGVEVRAFDAGGFERLQGKPVEVHQGDIRDTAALERCFEGADFVFHLAAIISIDGDRGGLVYDVNVGGARAAARAALAVGVRRFVHFSSIQAFDTRDAEGLVDESCRRSIADECAAYDRSKALGEVEVRRAMEEGLDVVVLHPTGVFGPRDPGPSKIGKALLDAARGRLPVLVDGGFDFVDVRDVADAAWNAAIRGERGCSYILSGCHSTMTEVTRSAAERAGAVHPMLSLPLGLVRRFAPLAKLMANATGAEPIFTRESLDLLATRARFSHERAARDLGFAPRPLEATVADLVDWYLGVGWLTRTPAPLSLRSRFALHVRDYPIDGPLAQRILEYALARVAVADGRIDPAERGFLGRFSDAAVEELAHRPPPSSAELETLGEATRESILLVATALADADREITAVEREVLARLAGELGIPSGRAAELEAWAIEFVVDEILDSLYADGVLDPGEQRDLERVASGLDLSATDLARADVRARSRRGLGAPARVGVPSGAGERSARSAELERAGTTCVVTGASSGIGEETALGLARLGARVVVICRNPERGKRSVERIISESGNHSVELVLADLSSQAEIHRVAANILDRCTRLDVLVNNAGVINTARDTTIDGFETTFAVNHLAYFLLTRLLLDRLAASGSARVVNVASVAHWWGRLALDDLQSERRYNSVLAYGTTKLANVLFTRQLARLLAPGPVTVNCVHPGLVATSIGRHNGPYARAMNSVLGRVFSSPAEGAEASIWAATAAELDGVSGEYLSGRRAAATSRTARDPDLATRLWEASSELTGLPARL